MNAPLSHSWQGLKGEPWVADPRKHAPGLDQVLIWAYERGASRIAFESGQPVWLRIHGRNLSLGTMALTDSELSLITNHFYGADGIARLRSGKPFDVSYEVLLSRTSRLRFRINATAQCTSRRDGVNIVMRPIPEKPPTLEQQLVEEGILEAYRPHDGMIVVSGATGSGKSTLIAGMTLAKLTDPEGHYNIIEGAAPVEFLFDRIGRRSSTISQKQIPDHLETFADFIRACMRAEPTDIIVGECRDSETMASAIQAAISGHALTTTLHANDVALTMQRIFSLCPAGERDNLISAVAQSLRLVINQRLTFATDGRRTALREFLVFDRALRTKFLETDPVQWPSLTRKAIESQGQSYAMAIETALREGRISSETAARERKEMG